MARRGVLLRLIGVVALVGVLCAVCLATAALPIVALGLFATLCGAGVVICSRRATR